ncbi:rod shape-determining protein MreD [Sporanaerobium hydrogeniformans]|uniref:Rod shape-determining protein MreD n=1 Tax=Sporanaerobium hydrogeniformans TaxID=3072179 RepID=A0AC61DF55_9FIRM|nr:rod shape-determining protein MreD [Sporanaerobium hydrogeniformans]PHV71483.1 rod shape-determining protein MreD [Sporanaerobium hydrogeniformans]
MRTTVIGLLLVVVQVLSTTIFQHLRIGNILPNFMIMIIVSFALLRGSTEGTLVGIAGGLLYDLSFGLLVGPTAIIYGGIGYIIGKLNRNFYRENFIIPFLCTLASNLVYSIFFTFGFMLRGKINFFFFFKSLIMPELIYTITLSLVVYQISYLINEKIEWHERKTRNIF